MKSIHLRFTCWFIGILFLASIFSFVLFETSGRGQQSKSNHTLSGNNSMLSQLPYSSNSNSKLMNSNAAQGDSGGRFIVLLYTIALSFVGIFNVYNALEVYKKKEQITAELNTVTKEYNELLNTLTIKHKEIYFDYMKMDIDVKQSRHELEIRLSGLSTELDIMAEAHMQNTKERLAIYCDELKESQQLLETQATAVRDDLEGYRKQVIQLAQELNICIYKDTLYSLIPSYISDNYNRLRVHSAAMWLSQNGESEELNILKERKDNISENDAELRAVFDQCIKDLEARLSVIERMGDIRGN